MKKRTFSSEQFTTHAVSTCPLLVENEARNAEKELMRGLQVMEEFEKSVTFFGSARLKPGTQYYEMTRRLAAECAKLGFAVVSGGGPGIMEAANRGAFEAGGASIGFNIELPHEQQENPYLTHSVPFEYFFTRKTAMTFTAEAFVCMPGGFGTFDEVFQVLCHIQTKKMPKVPVVLVGSEFWGPIDTLSRTILAERFHTIDLADTELYTVTDSEEEIVSLVKNAPLRDICKEISDENFIHEQKLKAQWDTLSDSGTQKA